MLYSMTWTLFMLIPEVKYVLMTLYLGYLYMFLFVQTYRLLENESNQENL